MKKYPKNLADATVLAETIKHLYECAENAEESAKSYFEGADGDTDNWQYGQAVEYQAKAEAYNRLAEKLCK